MKKKAFTLVKSMLVESMIVLLILIALAAIVIFKFTEAKAESYRLMKEKLLGAQKIIVTTDPKGLDYEVAYWRPGDSEPNTISDVTPWQFHALPLGENGFKELETSEPGKIIWIKFGTKYPEGKASDRNEGG